MKSGACLAIWNGTEANISCLQGGAMHEDDSLSGSSLTSRIALNYLITRVMACALSTPKHSLAGYAGKQCRLGLSMENLSPNLNGKTSAYYFATAQGPGDLQQEIMRSREIGYNGQFDFGFTDRHQAVQRRNSSDDRRAPGYQGVQPEQ